MEKQIKRFADSCTSCHKFKGTTHPKVTNRRYPIPPAPWSTMAIDLVGPLPETQDGNKFILVCVDHLTRYTAATALKTKSAKEVALALVAVFCEQGFPQILLSDNGKEFDNSLIKELAVIMNFSHRKICAYHPSSQGLVERKNGTLLIALRQLYHERPQDWDSCLRWAVLAVNSAYCSSIGDSPYFTLKHRDPDIPFHLCSTPQTSSKTPQQTVSEEKERAKAAYDIVKSKLLEAADRNARENAKKAKSSKIAVDQRVYIKYIKKKKGDNKLSPRFDGPFRVISQKSPHVFKLKNLTNNKVIEAHVENMKIVQEDVAPLDIFPTARLPLQDHRAEQVSPPAELDVASDSDDSNDSNDFLGF